MKRDIAARGYPAGGRGPGSSNEAGAPAALLELLARALAAALGPRDAQSAQLTSNADQALLLDVEETARLLRVSRMTVTRMADEGRLPSVVVCRGRTQKTRRIPRAFLDQVVAAASAGAQVDIEEFTAAWLAQHAHLGGAGFGDADGAVRSA